MDSLSFILLQFNHFIIWERDGLFKGERERKKNSMRMFPVFWVRNWQNLYFATLDWGKEFPKDTEFLRVISDS